ncbi:hypothetical protein N2152v2_003191 [Parachlorella kessleri]
MASVAGLRLVDHLQRSSRLASGQNRGAANSAKKGSQGLGADSAERTHATKGAERLYERDILEGKLFDLSGSTAFVTGSARGMGAAIAVGMARCGAKVVVSDILPEDQMAPVVEKIHKLGRDAISLQCDVRDRKAVDDAVKKAADHFGSLDIMCANAGILGKLSHADSISQRNWHEVMGINVEGVYNCARAAYPLMKRGGYGKLILMSSIAAVRGFGAQVAYCSSKGALLSMAKSLAVAWGKDNIQASSRVNCLLGGAINTPFLDQVLNTPHKVDYILHRIPAGRLGVPEDIVGPAVFLASRASDYVTGTEVVVDGGGIQVPMLADQNPEDYQV